jgi:hypothetical protein
MRPTRMRGLRAPVPSDTHAGATRPTCMRGLRAPVPSDTHAGAMRPVPPTRMRGLCARHACGGYAPPCPAAGACRRPCTPGRGVAPGPLNAGCRMYTARRACPRAPQHVLLHPGGSRLVCGRTACAPGGSHGRANRVFAPYNPNDLRIVAIPRPHVTIPRPHVTIPRPHVTIPLPHFTIPLPHFTIPLPHFTIPLPHVAIPHGHTYG